MRVSFGHHLSLSYRGGGEKWLTQLANELNLRGHDITVRCLPFWKRNRPLELDPKIDYKEGYFHKLDGDVAYITYHPLSWLSFGVKSPKIGGMHSNCYWHPITRQYGLLPNVANIVNTFVGSIEIPRFDMIHAVTKAYKINHPNVRFIPNFVDCDAYRPTIPKSDEFTVGYASRKVFAKGFDIFLKLEELLEDVKFITTNNIPEEKMPDFYSNNHLTIVPPRMEMCGLTVLESHGCETPVLSSGVPAHRGLKLPLSYAYSIDQYIETIEYFREIYESEIYKSLTSDCRKSVMKYDKKIIIDKLEEMFLEFDQ